MLGDKQVLFWPSLLVLQDDVCHAHHFSTARPGPRVLGPALCNEPPHRVRAARVHGRSLSPYSDLDDNLHVKVQSRPIKLMSSSGDCVLSFSAILGQGLLKRSHRRLPHILIL